jgi:dimethylamine--corrinoid protein Co-methyltransferase
VGVGDMMGMPIAHAVASGLNGLRAAGDLVARLQMARGMRLAQAKDYAAGKLGISTLDLSDNVLMHELRGELRLGRLVETEAPQPFDPSPMEAKRRIGELLDLPINALEQRGERQ